MKKIIAATVALLVCAFAVAQTTKRAEVVYVPKKPGQVKQRTDGATRGGMEQPPPVVRVLTPLEIASTSSDQPTLYWFISQPTKYKCDVVIKTMKDEPVFEQSFDGIKEPGLVAIDLSKATKKLEPGKDYRFLVLVAVDPKEPASDIESSGTLRYEPPAEDVQKQLASAKGIDRAVLLAQQGYFTDAVAALKSDASPEAADALKGLLAQVKLDVATKK
jgi:hypothetical protein